MAVRVSLRGVSSRMRVGSYRLRLKVVVPVIVAFLLVGGVASAASIVHVGIQADGSAIVTSYQRVKSAGTTLLIGERPVDMSLRPDGKQIALETTTITYLVDPATQKVTQKFDKGGRSYAGLAYSPDGKSLAYAKGGGHAITIAPIGVDGTVDTTKLVSVDTGTYTRTFVDPDPNAVGLTYVPEYGPATGTTSSWPGGLSWSPDGKKIYVALFGTNQMGIIDVTVATPTLTTVNVGSSPFGAFTSPDGKNVYVSNWGGDLPATYNPADGNTLDALWPNADAYFPVKVDPKTGASIEGTVTIYNVANKNDINAEDRPSPDGDHL